MGRKGEGKWGCEGEKGDIRDIEVEECGCEDEVG